MSSFEREKNKNHQWRPKLHLRSLLIIIHNIFEVPSNLAMTFKTLAALPFLYNVNERVDNILKSR